jgi:hypothetical protein
MQSDYVISKAARDLGEFEKSLPVALRSAEGILNRSPGAASRVLGNLGHSTGKRPDLANEARNLGIKRRNGSLWPTNPGKLGVESGAAGREAGFRSKRLARAASLKAGMPGRPVLP